jgi:carbon-monoxide dehydrogenase medium subunit
VQAFDYARPARVADAVELLARHGDRARILAGGTDLVVGLRHGTETPRVVVDIKGLTDLPAAVSETTGPETAGAVRIGATAVLADLAAHPLIRASFPALVEAMGVVGSIEIRNRATLAGNVCHASPAADTAPALLVHDARIVIAGPAGERRVPLPGFLLGPGRTALGPGEIVTAVELPVPARPLGTAFARMTRRRGVDLATVSLCCAVDGAGVTRFGYGAAGPVPFLVTDETGVLADGSAPAAARDAALDRLIARARPVTDVRAGRDYRIAMLRVLSNRALSACTQQLVASRKGRASPGAGSSRGAS